MTDTSEREDNVPVLSANAVRMAALRDKVFATWETRVRERVPQAQALQHPLLVDTLPVFYDNIVESVSPDCPRTSAVDGTTVATEHGGERARITAYDHGALIEEYQVFRWAIFHVLHAEGVVLEQEEMHTINSSIDAGIREAVEAFSLVSSGFRERFAAALTHDMRGPLGATVTALELILMTNDVTRMKTAAAKALTNAQRMAGMIDELLDTMAFHSGQQVKLALAQVDILEVAKEVQADVLATHGPRIDVAGAGVRGVWDRASLKRVLENLVGNALKYGAPGAPITITLEQTRGRLVMAVHNEGPPIPPAEQECIFQMYRRAEAAPDDPKLGWGIGLPYVRAVAESHGGSIGIDSSVERGTTFVVDIPLDARMLPAAPTLA